MENEDYTQSKVLGCTKHRITVLWWESHKHFYESISEKDDLVLATLSNSPLAIGNLKAMFTGNHVDHRITQKHFTWYHSR